VRLTARGRERDRGVEGLLALLLQLLLRLARRLDRERDVAGARRVHGAGLQALAGNRDVAGAADVDGERAGALLLVPRQLADGEVVGRGRRCRFCVGQHRRGRPGAVDRGRGVGDDARERARAAATAATAVGGEGSRTTAAAPELTAAAAAARAGTVRA